MFINIYLYFLKLNPKKNKGVFEMKFKTHYLSNFIF